MYNLFTNIIPFLDELINMLSQLLIFNSLPAWMLVSSNDNHCKHFGPLIRSDNILIRTVYHDTDGKANFEKISRLKTHSKNITQQVMNLEI